MSVATVGNVPYNMGEVSALSFSNYIGPTVHLYRINSSMLSNLSDK